MTSPLVKRLQVLLSVLSVLVLLALGAAGWFYWHMRGSLAQLDGAASLPGLSGAVKVERDALGVPRITGANRNDVARSLGFVHAQDRFFQMDLLRRRGAGELAELFGPNAVGLDRAARLHDLRRTAARVVEALPADQRAVLEAYVAGVNHGLAALRQPPWEYTVLRVEPRAWTAEDSVLCIYAMWFDLQDERGRYDLERHALRLAYGASGLAFFSPRGTSADAALDGSTFPVPDLPGIRLKAVEDKPTAARPPLVGEPELVLGSNSFAVDGAHSANGVAILANDMHLGFPVPNIWYRAELGWKTATGEARRVVGVTLPGLPAVVVGSNGAVAWGFTNSAIDTTDVLLVEHYSELQYRAPGGWRDIEDRTSIIKVRGEPDQTFTARWTEWGPITGAADEGSYYAIRWNAHDPESTNLRLLDFEDITSVAAGLRLAPVLGMPNQNLLLADRDGRIGWTITGRIPRRAGHDGRVPVSWGYGDRRWQGWLKPEEHPVATTSPLGLTAEIRLNDGVLWTANNRLVGGETYARIGENHYDNGHRAAAIRDGLLAVVANKKAEVADVFAVQLDDRARLLDRWQKLLLSVLNDEAVAKNKTRRQMRDLVAAWNGHAAVDSSAYRLIREFKDRVYARALAPFIDGPQRYYESFRWGPMIEDSVWQLLTEKPARLLNPEHRSWDSLLLAAADDVIASAADAGTSLAKYTWGARNRLRMAHPFARFLPGPLAAWISMPADPLPGDRGLPRVQTPEHGASQRLVVEPGREDHGILHMPGGQSGHPLSPFFRAGHDDWAKGRPTPLLPSAPRHTLTLAP